MKKHKAFFSISLVILMILLLGMNGLVFAEENTSSAIGENTGFEENSTGNAMSSDGLDDTQPGLESLPTDTLSSENSISEPSVNESGNTIEPTEEEEAVGGTTWDTAMNINLNQQYSDSVPSGNYNYYTFTISDPGELSVTFDHEYEDSSSNYWSIRVYNTNNRNKNLTDWYFKGNETVSVKTDSLGLPAGSYFVVIGDGNYHSSKNYNFKVNYTKSDAWEKELNNTFVTATEIPVNTDINGSLIISGDEDYYSFELSKPGRVRVSFDHGVVDSGSYYWNINLYKYDDTVHSFLDTHFVGNAVTTAYTSYFGLPDGKYVLRIGSSNYYSSYNYKFNINYLENNYWEKERNNSFLEATGIGTNVDISGSLQYSGDNDFFSFTIPESDDISFSFKHDLVNSGSNYWALELYNYDNMNKCLRTEYFKGNEPDVVKTSSSFLEAGKYIVAIKDGNYYSNGVYTFKVNSSKNNKNVTGVSVEPKSVSINIGGSAQLTATVTPADATNPAVTWKSSNTKIATVDTTGNVTGVKDGTAIISVTTTDGGFTAIAKVTVGNGGSEEPETGDDQSDPETELTPAADGSYSYTLLLGEKYKVNITDLNRKSLKSGNSRIVSVADKNNGVVQGKKVGSTDVTCKVDGEEKTIHFKVEYPAISAHSNYVLVGDSLQFAIKGTGISNIKWSVNNSNASISETGTLTGLKAGTTQVTAKIHKRNYKVKITVEKPKFAKPTYEIAAGKIAKIKLGGTKQGARVSYSISDETVATIIPDGRIAALSPGTATLTATLGDKSYTTQIIVE